MKRCARQRSRYAGLRTERPEYSAGFIVANTRKSAWTGRPPGPNAEWSCSVSTSIGSRSSTALKCLIASFAQNE